MSDNVVKENNSIHEEELNCDTKTTALKNQGKHTFVLSNSQDSENHLSVVAKKVQHLNLRGIDPSPHCTTDVSGSTYALQELQIALKNMKERYQKLQNKLAVIEDENTRLIGGKSELFGEIGKMQESSIKLREKNLKLNHEVHSKHQEYCSVQEQLTAFSHENVKLTSKLMQISNEKKKLVQQVVDLDKENNDLREGLNQLLISCRMLPGGVNLELGRIEAVARRSKIRNDYEKNVFLNSDFKLESHDINKMNESDDEDDDGLSTLWLDSTKDVDTLSIEAIELSKRKMRKMVSILVKQKEALQKLTPYFEQTHQRETDFSSNEDKRLDTIFNSNLATYNSSNNPATITLTEDGIRLSPPLNDSGGETNVLVEEKIVSGRHSPFDWREVEVSDDDVNDPPTMVGRPQMRTVSTSPDRTFELTRRRSPSNLDDDDRMCPMCNAVFPWILPLETFESHVVSHFEIENGFEVIT